MRHVIRALVLGLVVAGGAAAQTPATVEAADEAYRGGQYDEAVRVLERVIDADPDRPEAHYLLARVLRDEQNPGRDDARAGRAIDRALELAPDNAVYLAARLEHLRSRSSNFFQELYRRQQRRSLAAQLIALDPDNGVAHEELGVQALFDYYTYRNAIAFPNLSFVSRSRRLEEDVAPESPVGASSGGAEGGGTGETVLDIDAVPTLVPLPEAGDIGTDNRFDLDRLEAAGAAVISYRERAERAYVEAIGHLRMALDTDPRRRDAYDHLVRLAALSGRYDDVLPDIREMYRVFPEDPQMWQYLGLVNHRQGLYEAADVAFRNAFERMDEESRRAFTDLRLILPPEDHAAYAADPERFTQRYWTSRDPRFLNGVNERRTEHYARLTTADLLYRADDLGIPGWDTERGRLHVRYGLPLSDVVIEGGFGEVLEQFADRNEAFEVPEMQATANRFNVWDYGDFMLVFEDPNRTGDFRLYSPPADLFSLEGAREVYQMDYVQQAEERVRETPERYTFEAPGRGVELPYRITAFKGDEGRTDVYVNYGIPVAVDAPEAGLVPDVDVTVRTGAFLIGPERDLLVERRRTVYGLRGAQIVPFEETSLWTSTEAMSATPGTHEVSLEFETASGQTSAVQRRALEVPSFAGDGLQLSDVLLAYFVEEADDPQPGRVFRDGLSVQPAPWGVFGVGDPIYLFFEVYNLGLAGGQSDFEVEARLEPKDTSRGLRRLARRVLGSSDAGVSTAYEAQGDRPDEVQYLILDAADQEPGLYTLTVTVRDRVSGRSVDRETDLLLE